MNCSECGKTCGCNAHSNMKGKFANMTLCGLCFIEYKNCLDKQLNEMEIREKQLKQSGGLKEWSEAKRYGSELLTPLGRLHQVFTRLNQEYFDLTGERWLTELGRWIAFEKKHESV